jgi:hypothetical protein
MTINIIKKKQFDMWASEKFIEYASESVSRKGNGVYLDRLRFMVRLSGGYKVTLGDQNIYDGDSFMEAANAYHRTALT